LSHIATTNDSTTYPSSNLIDLAGASLRQNYLIYALAILFSAVLAGFITSSRTKSKEVKFFSEYDVMTNALNRHSGIDKLSDAYKSLSKSNCNMSICFLDINGLKEINDTLGHEAGDELIITVAKTIRSVIRSNDFLVRLGGDEFLIALQGVDEDRAEEVWSRIVSEFDNINNTEHRKYLISVSHGIKTLSCNLNQVLDNVLHQADVKMYDEKRRIKANLQIIRK
jgi:diguanylate cyclase (GGDEF)-like protein